MSPRPRQTLPARPHTSSKTSTKSTSSSQSSPNEDSTESPSIGTLLFVILLLGELILVPIYYQKGLERGARNLTELIPDGKIFTEREGLRKEKKRLRQRDEFRIDMERMGRFQHIQNENPRNREIDLAREIELAKEIEALDKRELAHLRERAIVLEDKLKTRIASTETDRAWKIPHEAFDAGILPDKTHPEPVHGSCPNTADLRLIGLPVGTAIMGPFRCPNYSGEKADPHMRQAEEFPSAKVVPQVPSHGLQVNETPRTLPHRDNSMAHPEPDRKPTGPPSTQTEPIPASDVTLDSISANNDATNEEMGQIKRAKEALKHRERELEAQGKDRKKRMQELNSPKADQILPIASGMLLGSALAFGVTMMISVVRN